MKKFGYAGRGNDMGLSRESSGTGAADRGLNVKKRKESDIIVALAGNPNVGKSTVFNAMTGLRQHTGNWPGKTVANAQGYASYEGQGYVMVDIPGCYSLQAHSAEEEVAGEFIRSGIPDAVVVVCDAVCLERSLGLALQVMEITEKVVVCVNLMDEAAKKHITIDLRELENRLGVPVVGTAARNAVGIDGICRAVNRVCGRNVLRREKKIGRENQIRQGNCPEKICDGIIQFEDAEYLLPDRKKDRFFTGKRTGIPVMFLLLLLIFWLTIAGANYPSELLHAFLFRLEGKLMDILIFLGVPSMLRQALIYGMYRVLAWVVSVMLPPMAIFFPLFTILEDAGYLPRVAFNLDKCFQKCRACGKQSLTMLMGFGCNAVGVTGSRIIDSPRERLIAILTNSFVPCNGRFPTLIAIITMFFVTGTSGSFTSLAAAFFLAAFIVLGIFMTFFVSRLLSATVLKGMSSSYVMELPPYRRPQVGKVIVRSVFDRTMFVLGRAVLAAAPAGVVIWLMANLTFHEVTALSYIAEALDPFGRLLGMDGVILLAFLLGFPANEIVVPIIIMAYLMQGTLSDLNDIHALKQQLVSHGWTWVTAVSTMLFSMFHWPCATTCLTIKKETGSLKWMLVSVLLPTVTGCVVCFVFHLLADCVVFFLH